MVEEEIKMETVQDTEETASAEPQKAESAQKDKIFRKGKDKKEDKKCEELQKKVDELADKLSAEHNDYLRLMAEFETFRRRSAEERLALVASAASDTVKGFLPVLDDLDAAMKVMDKSEDKSSLEGINLIYTKLLDYLKSLGLETIDAVGKDFDTDYHEALTQIPAPSEELKGKVIEVFKTGYTFKGKVIRFAKVVVGA